MIFWTFSPLLGRLPILLLFHHPTTQKFQISLQHSDDVSKLWGVDLKGKVLAAHEYFLANLANYFTEVFLSNHELSSTFEGQNQCYFNTGVMTDDCGCREMESAGKLYTES